MRTIYLFIAFMTLILSAPLSAADKTDISGDWRIYTTSHKGYETWELKITADGAKYNLIAIHQYLGYCEGTLTLNGNEIKMVFIGKTPGTKATVVQTFTFTGTVEGETMRGTKITEGENLHGDDKPVAWVALKKNDNVK
jgi:hypothetical protein